jgi:hypothetical protein
MKTSESIKNIAVALLASQKLMGGAKKGASNPYFKSKYADLGSVLEACKELLNEAGVAILQPHSNRDGKNFVETILLHAASGEWISSETEVVCSKQNDPQALGSAITYARRYGLQSLLSMPAEDDDGEGAMSRAPKSVAPAVKSPVVEAKVSAPASAPVAKIQAIDAAKPAAVTPTATAAPVEAKAKPSFRKATPAAATAAPAAPAPAAAKANGLGW